MTLYRTFADRENLPDLFVASAIGQVLQNLKLTL